MRKDDAPKPLLKRLKLDEDIQDLNVPISIEISFATSAKLSDMAILEKVIDLAVADVQRRFEKDGFKVYIRAGLVKPMTQEELLSVLPRKVHLAHELSGVMKQICETPHVSRKNLTTNKAQVTCKRCRRLIIEGASDRV